MNIFYGRAFIVSIFFAAVLLVPLSSQAVFIGEERDFFVDKAYDIKERDVISATLLKIGPEIYYYAEKSWWNSFTQTERNETFLKIESLDKEFHENIYPTLTATFGNEWKPGIDNDSRMTVLLHPMKDDAGGYTNYGDEYSILQNPKSNEREMMYLNTDFIASPMLKSFLAHEFVHVITFNQKEILHGVSEETWLNEARAEYASTILKYDDTFEDSNLKQRIQAFIQNPTDSLLEWNSEKRDYAVVNLFTQYLVDQYGIEILKDSLKSSKAGIASLSEALKVNGFTATFFKVFTDWTIAVLVNDCSLGERYCYKNENLKNFRVVPQTNFLPFAGESTFSLVNTTKDWSANWYKLVGGNNILKVEFQGNPSAAFTLPYLVENREGKITLQFVSFDKNQKGGFELENHKENRSLILIPSLQTSIINAENFFPYPFVLTFSTSPRTQKQEQAIIDSLLVRIDFLIKEIARVRAQLAKVQASAVNSESCGIFTENLFFGARDSFQVRCLQSFLASQGDDIYPAKVVTGNFFTLTLDAVIRFQEKYREDILVPLSLPSASGYVGALTRAKINSLL